MESLYKDEPVPYKLETYTLEIFAQLDVSTTPHIVSYSIYPEEFNKPTPIGFIIIEPEQFAVFTYYDRYNDVWIVEDKCRLQQSVNPISSKLSYLEDSIVLYGADCDPIIEVYQTMCETLESVYGVESIEPIEIARGVDEEVEISRCQSCTPEDFEYHRSEENANITLYICQQCHNIVYIEFAGLKYTTEKLTVDLLFEKTDVQTISVTESDSLLIPSESPSFFDTYVAYIWWQAFKQSGGLEKYAPDIEQSVLFTRDDEIVGFIAWNTLKGSDIPVVQNAYITPKIGEEAAQKYYKTFMKEFDFEKLLIHRSIQDLPTNPSQYQVETEPIIVVNPSILTDRDEPIENII